MLFTLQIKDILNYLIALIAAWIAYQQWKTNRDKLRLDLYNKRFDIYSKTIIFYQALLSYDASKPDEDFSSIHKDFIKSCRESQFLFSKKSGIFQILENLHSEAFKIIGFKNHAKDMVSAPEILLEMQNSMQQALSIFDVSIKELESKMVPYLNFQKVA